MNLHLTNKQRRILSSQQKVKADFILRNAQVADVFNLQWRQADIVVSAGYIVAIDSNSQYEAEHEEDAAGRYVIPGLIDGHIHIESSMLTPSEFSRILLPHGITTVITDPHEIANVSGAKGIQYMLDDAKNAVMDIHVMLPSSVPSTAFENAGAVLEAEDLAPFLTHPDVLGLAEVMDFPAVLEGNEKMLAKIEQTESIKRIVDGHGAGLSAQQIRGYRAAGIQTDHECVTAEEARNRVQQGMYVLIREGSAAKNLRALLPAVTPTNAHRFLFCTDDKHLDELMHEGSINYDIALAIKEGMEPLQAIQLATLNAATCYQLQHKGALAEGFLADFILLEDIQTCKPQAVWKNGEKVAKNGHMLQQKEGETHIPTTILQSVNIPALTAADLTIPFNKGTKANIIDIQPNQLMTSKRVADVTVENGVFVSSVKDDLLKLAVIERHHQLGNIGLGITHGFGLQKGAVATTVAHDSHNALVLGTNDADMLLAVEALQNMQGGYVVVADGEILSALPLPIAGLMTDQPAPIAEKQLNELHEALLQLNPDLDFHLFLTLSFISLPVIPDIKLTDTGLFDVVNFQHIAVEVE
ncbi:adenine deaminase [Viridibacillus sp. YIM B01967]|uniref:Adenine deaminase n=1 Tax=Viridibacillus soli TaxID=2798301 RepID=A0ABS1HBP2_9BACL|nr:adenine deaminase [Viridibacillus soli]MBK3496869.1 adenine deaminase [Viridibacillus soli]